MGELNGAALELELGLEEGSLVGDDPGDLLGIFDGESGDTLVGVKNSTLTLQEPSFFWVPVPSSRK